MRRGYGDVAWAELKDRIWDTLSTHARGVNNVMRGVALAEHVGVPAPDAFGSGASLLRAAIREMKLEGLPVCGMTGHGYYVPDTEEERAEACRLALRRISVQAKVIKTLNGLSANEAQMQLLDDLQLLEAA